MTAEEQSRRCSDHCDLVKTARGAVPRWAFLSSLSAIIVLGVALAGWYEHSLSKSHADFATGLVHLEAQHIRDIDTLSNDYVRSVERFHQTANINNRLLVEATKERAEIKAKQDIVLQQLRLSNGRSEKD